MKKLPPSSQKSRVRKPSRSARNVLRNGLPVERCGTTTAVAPVSFISRAVSRIVVCGETAAGCARTVSAAEAARDADMLVLGSRGRGGFAGLKLGSVSQECAQYATCPVVIVKRLGDV